MMLKTELTFSSVDLVFISIITCKSKPTNLEVLVLRSSSSLMFGSSFKVTKNCQYFL
ncbi:hypothetical protein KFK09_015451 [Dendrobium nobile]|uniref:Uncharacterized protein n=1 Tax=Dendrobium nobile TaxID=94219 RepID=A0A8T3B6U4_DENNO|nr:hypothetical protein KFK09_015451 [Dendrobium nobile]